MNYSDYHSKSKFKGSAAFYIIIACCLLAIGGASWFAASNISRHEADKGSSMPGSSSEPKTPSSIPDPIIEPPAVTPSGDVANSVSDEPYTSEPQAEPTEEPTPEISAFKMPVQGEIIKDYSEKQLQYSATYGDMRLHSGIDIACESGTAVSAAGNGTVLSVEDSATLGTVVSIDHGNGITAKYAAIKDATVKAGDKIAVGDIIGTVTTVPGECADQSHLHFEVYKDGHAAVPLPTLGLD